MGRNLQSIVRVDRSQSSTDTLNLTTNLEPDAIDRLADPKQWKDPEPCEDVPQNGAQPRKHSRV